MSKIIFLNGCGSSGKTKIARDIQAIAETPWLHFSMDTFCEMLPEQYVAPGVKAEDGYFIFTKSKNDRGELMKISRGPLCAKIFDTLPSIAKLLADNGNDLIIDEVLLSDDNLKTYINALKEHYVYFIGVFCDLKTLQEREKLRGDRAIGLANAQYDVVHASPREYDFKVDTSKDSSDKIAEDILDFIKNNPDPTAFKNM